MVEPETLTTIINGIVSLLTVYANYRIAAKNAEGTSASPPVRTEEIEKGAEVATAVETVVSRYGQQDEKTALAGFKENPDLFESVFRQSLERLAVRSPEAAQELRMVAVQANVGQAAASIVNIHNNASNYGAQGTFNAPVTFHGPLSPKDDA